MKRKLSPKGEGLFCFITPTVCVFLQSIILDNHER